MNSDERKQMGQRIKRLREEKLPMSQDALAEMLGMKRANVANYEAGRAMPPGDVLRRLATIFDVSTDYILGVNAVPEELDSVYEIGDALQEERQHQGMTQAQLSEATGIPQRRISQFERNVVSIPSGDFEKIVAAFGLSVVFFLDKYNLYDEAIPEHFDGNVDAYHNFKRAEEFDALHEEGQRYTPVSEEIPDEFGPWFADIRMKSGFRTQRDLADASGVNVLVIERIESGVIPRVDTLEKIAKVMKASNLGEMLRRAGLQSLVSTDEGFRFIARARETMSVEAYEELISWSKNMAQVLEKKYADKPREDERT